MGPEVPAHLMQAQGGSSFSMQAGSGSPGGSASTDGRMGMGAMGASGGFQMSGTVTQSSSSSHTVNGQLVSATASSDTRSF